MASFYDSPLHGRSFYQPQGTEQVAAPLRHIADLGFSNVIGTAALVFYTFPYLGIIFVPLSILYYATALYYRRTSVETKRLDSLMRSALYASYSGKSSSRRFVTALHQY